MRKFFGVVTCALALGVAAAASAHHSFAAFDNRNPRDIKGTVVQFDWVNPHSRIVINVPNAAGQLVKWDIEANAPNIMTRQGWSKSTLKPGDVVTINVQPKRDGSAGARLLSIVLASGKRLYGDVSRPTPAS